MIFMVWQLSERAIEHNSKQFFVFMNSRKAYDSVSHDSLWIFLRKFGVSVPSHFMTVLWYSSIITSHTRGITCMVT